MALTERSLASRLPPGSIAAFFYASTIVSVPLSLIVRPVTTMLFPRMVQIFKKDVRAGLSTLGMPIVALVTASAGVVLLVSLLAEPIVETVFVRGRFSLDHAKLTAAILSVTIFALPFMSVGQLIRNACYSLSDYRSPIVGLAVQWMMVIGLGTLLLPRYGARGLAAALVSGEAAVLGVTGFLLMRQVSRS
jgi:putative peptidoglycan lipid II flippase